MSEATDGRVLPLAGSLRRPVIWLLAILATAFAGLGVALSVAFARLPPEKAPPGSIGFLVVAIAVLAMGFTLRAILRAGVSVDQGELVIDSGFGVRRFRLSDLRAGGLREVDLGRHAELKPFLRLWGAGLPGFSSGWFRLRNGEKALCVLLDRSRVSCLRSGDENITLLLSLRDPAALRRLLER